jgi:hypothetical protein
MASKKQHEAFNKQAENILVSFGAIPNETKYTSMYKWQLQTKFGVLIISIPTPDKGSVFSVYSQFADYDQYKDQLKGITDHWKWNVHQWEADMAITDLKQRLNRVCEANETTNQ